MLTGPQPGFWTNIRIDVNDGGDAVVAWAEEKGSPDARRYETWLARGSLR